MRAKSLWMSLGVFLIALAAPVRAGTTTTLEGKLYEGRTSDGTWIGAVPNELVILRRPDNPVFQKGAMTRADGSYTFAYLPDGDYVISVPTRMNACYPTSAYERLSSGGFTKLPEVPGVGAKVTLPGAVALPPGQPKVVNLAGPAPCSPTWGDPSITLCQSVPGNVVAGRLWLPSALLGMLEDFTEVPSSRRGTVDGEGRLCFDVWQGNPWPAVPYADVAPVVTLEFLSTVTPGVPVGPISVEAGQTYAFTQYPLHVTRTLGPLGATLNGDRVRVSIDPTQPALAGLVPVGPTSYTFWYLGGTLPVADFHFSRAATLSGRVYVETGAPNGSFDGTDAPVAGEAVSVWDMGRNPYQVQTPPMGPMYTTSTDSDGRYEFPDLHYGYYMVSLGDVPPDFTNSGRTAFRTIDANPQPSLDFPLSVSISGPASIVRPAEQSGSATVPILLWVESRSGAVPSGAQLVVSDVTDGRPGTLLYGADAVAGSMGFAASFPVGTSYLAAEVVSASGDVLASLAFTVQIEDASAPTLLGVADKTIELSGVLTPIFPSRLGISATDDSDPNPSISLSPRLLALGGPHDVTATARDGAGHTTSETFHVTVVDTRPPRFSVVPTYIAADDLNGDGSEVIAFDLLATDLSGVVMITCTDETGADVEPEGSAFAVGEHVVTCRAVDGSGNATLTSFEVAVMDVTDPVLVLPADISTGTDPGECTAVVSFTVTASDAGDGVTVTATVLDEHGEPTGLASGDPFPVGTMVVTCTATDAAGNTASGSFQVVVRDEEEPVLTAPTSATLMTDCEGHDLSVSAAALGVTATDNCDPNPTFACEPSTLSPGVTSVTVRATDDDGNVAETTVAVTVLKGAFDVAILKPLEGSIDNKITVGRVVPVQVRVTCAGVVQTDVAATIHDVTRIDGSGTPIAETLADAELSSDDGAAMRFVDGVYKYNLSTSGWASGGGARFRVTVRIRRSGHVDTFVSVILRNK